MRLLTFDHVLSLRMLVVMLLGKRFCFQYTAMFYTSEVRTIILKCPIKSCDLYPFPTVPLKRCIDQLIHPNTSV